MRFAFLTMPRVRGRFGRPGDRVPVSEDGTWPAGRKRPAGVRCPSRAANTSWTWTRSSRPSARWCTPEACWVKQNSSGPSAAPISVQTSSMSTSMEGVFAAGDQVTGPATVVEAIGGGKKAADAIDRYLSGLPQPKMPPVPVRRTRLECLQVAAPHQDDFAPSAHAAFVPRTPPGDLPAGRTRVFGKRGPRRGPPLPALRHLHPLRKMRHGLSRQDGSGRSAAGIPGPGKPGRQRISVSPPNVASAAGPAPLTAPQEPCR